MPNQYKTNDNQTITISDDKLGSGGEGSVYHIMEPTELRDYCAKIIHQHQRTKKRQDKICFMTENAPKETKKDNFLICWPAKLLFDGNEFVGYIMPLAKAGSIQLYNFTTPKLRKPLLKKWEIFDRETQTGINNLLRLCVNIAYTVHSIHSYGTYVLVDLKPQNILVSPEGKISLIDLDSIEISKDGKILHQARVTTPEYMPPESRNINIAEELIPQSWDNFSMAVIFYQLIMGLHPYAATAGGKYTEATTLDDKIHHGLFPYGKKANSIENKPEYHDYFQQLPSTFQELFFNAFERGNLNTELRSKPRIWGQIIFERVNSNHLLLPYKKRKEHSGKKKSNNFILNKLHNLIVKTEWQSITEDKTIIKVSARSDNNIEALISIIGVVLFVFYLGSSTSINKTTIGVSIGVLTLLSVLVVQFFRFVKIIIYNKEVEIIEGSLGMGAVNLFDISEIKDIIIAPNSSTSHSSESEIRLIDHSNEVLFAFGYELPTQRQETVIKSLKKGINKKQKGNK